MGGGVRMDVESDGGVSASLLVTRLSFHLRRRRGSGCIAPPYQKRTNHPGEERRREGGEEGTDGRMDGQTERERDRQAGRLEEKGMGALSVFSNDQFVYHFVGILSPSPQA